MLKKTMAVVAGLIISGIFLVALSAAPKKKACNDLKIDRCKERKECVWVKAHKTKDGIEVKAHCKCRGKCN